MYIHIILRDATIYTSKKKTRSMILSEAETAYASGAPEFNRDF